MMKHEIFPLGLATGEYFCNRVEERKWLSNHLKKHCHTLITSPRRYGKSSLVTVVLKSEKHIYAKIDYFVALNAKIIEEQLLAGVEELFTKTSGKVQQIINELKDYLKRSQWVIGIRGVGLVLIPKEGSDPATNIKEALQALERYLAKKKKSAILFIDEFQELGILPEAKSIEGAIRHVAQESRYLTFVFSGSNRHILSNMFDDRSRPLYMLCNRIALERINEEDYIAFLNKFAIKTWGVKLPKDTCDEIFRVTERHPYYMNVLCNYLWENHEDNSVPPAAELVMKYWTNYVQTEKFRIAKELSNLSFGQRNVLTAIANGFVSQLTSRKFQQLINLSGASIVKILKNLEDGDFIGKKQDNTYFIIDPLLKFSLQLYYKEMLVIND